MVNYRKLELQTTKIINYLENRLSNSLFLYLILKKENKHVNTIFEYIIEKLNKKIVFNLLSIYY